MAAALAATCLLSCSSGTSVARPSPTAPPGEASNQSLLAYYGSYRTGDGDTLVIARLGWFFDMGDGTYRTIFTTHEATHFTIGRTFKEPLPKFADLVFGQGTLTISEGSRSRVGLRLRYRQTDVKIAAAGAELAGTITEPLGNEPHPGIVIVHGAERGERYFYDVWVGIYTSMGLAVRPDTGSPCAGGAGAVAAWRERPHGSNHRLRRDPERDAQAELHCPPATDRTRAARQSHRPSCR